MGNLTQFNLLLFMWGRRLIAILIKYCKIKISTILTGPLINDQIESSELLMHSIDANIGKVTVHAEFAL